MCVCETNTTRQFCNRRGEICFAGLEPTKASASMREPLIHIKCLVVMWLPKLWRGMYEAMRCPPVSHGITRGGVPSKLSQIAHFDGWYEWVTCTATPSANTGEAMLRLIISPCESVRQDVCHVYLYLPPMSGLTNNNTEILHGKWKMNQIATQTWVTLNHQCLSEWKAPTRLKITLL